MPNKITQSRKIPKKKVLYVVPIPYEYIKLWIWYKIDNDILEDLGYEVIFSNNIKESLNNLSKVDIVYGWWWARMAIYIFFCKIFRKKLIISGAIHMFDLIGVDDFWRFSFLKKNLIKISLKFSDANIFMSKDQYQSITSHIKTKNPQLVYSCTRHNIKELKLLKTKKIKWVKEKYKFKNNSIENLRICTVCWLTKESQIRKGLTLLMESYLVLKKWNFDLPKLTIIGKDGNGLDKLKKFIYKNNLNNFIDVKVNVSFEDKNNILLNSHFYVQSSWIEGFGNAVLESMEQGTPALVSRYTAQPEVVGDAGIINFDQSPEGLANEIKKLFTIDKSKYLDMVHKGYQRMEKLFVYEKRKEKFKNIFENI